MATHETYSYEDYLTEIKKFIKLSDKINDDWKLYKSEKGQYNTYVKKECYREILLQDQRKEILKSEYFITYNVSYAVPTISFNYWRPTGELLSLKEIRNLSLIKISPEDIYSVITQQEHPLLFKPCYTVHPCHTGSLLSNFKHSSNLIVSFLTLVSPLIQLNIPLDYAMQ